MSYSVSSSDNYYLFSEGLNDRYNRYNKSNIKGGSKDKKDNKDKKDRATGGFPPIYVMPKSKDKNVKEEIKDKKDRKFESIKTSISIKQLLEKKKVN